MCPALFMIIMNDVAKDTRSEVRQFQVEYQNLKPICISESTFADDVVIFR